MKHLLLITALFAVLNVSAQDKVPKQCKGITVKNVQCKNRAQANSEYCKLHDPAGFTCGKPTSKGTPCKRHVSIKGERCWQHSHGVEKE